MYMNIPLIIQALNPENIQKADNVFVFENEIKKKVCQVYESPNMHFLFLRL